MSAEPREHRCVDHYREIVFHGDIAPSWICMVCDRIVPPRPE